MTVEEFAVKALAAYVDHVLACVADACPFCTPADAANVREFLSAVDDLREEGPPCPSP